MRLRAVLGVWQVDSCCSADSRASWGLGSAREGKVEASLVKEGPDAVANTASGLGSR